MLRHISVLSEMAQVPFIGNASAKFFGSDSYEEVMNNRFLSDIISEDTKYTSWRSFREDDRAKYIGLTLCSCLLMIFCKSGNFFIIFRNLISITEFIQSSAAS